MKQFYLETISGRRRGILAGFLRFALSAGTVVYSALHTTRRLAYRIGLFRAVRLPVPVISVGNLTAGGTGKTPLVEHLARWFARRNFRTVVLARGYGRTGTPGRDDEDLFAEMEIENTVRLTGRNRAALARRALQDFRPDLFILDDGFQHYRIRRDLDILVIDSTNPFAGDRILPRGLLRERPHHARRADLIVLSRCDQSTPQERRQLNDRLGRAAPGKPVVETQHRPVQVRVLSSRKRSGLEWLKDRTVYAFCGIGNPDAFRRTLESLQIQVAKFRAFEDHHVYTARELRQINAVAQEFMADVILTTEKDARKLEPDAFDLPLAALTVEIEVLRGEEQLETLLRSLVVVSSRIADTAAAP